ncbi:hypothetical protein [Clostridium perfringens]|uniref:hypothetical protein n=1 Tax=Clostridium perfringens TaxID=1502 RepID=UPI0022E86D50|nr:hypothetical protein [Clostridium perfringens]
MASINESFLKNFSEEIIILLSSKLSLYASGLYKDDWTTAPTPNSPNAINPKNCVIEDTSPLTDDPKYDIYNFGKINPQIKVTT